MRGPGRRWQDAGSQKRFYQALTRIFAVGVLLFTLAALVLFFVDATRAGAGATFVTGIVSGALAAFFLNQQHAAEKTDETLFQDYQRKCPDPIRTALDAE